MITDYIYLSATGVSLKLANITGIYRDRNPADKGKIIKHWIKYSIDGKTTKVLYNSITHPEYAVIKVAANYNQIRNTYIAQGTVTISD